MTNNENASSSKSPGNNISKSDDIDPEMQEQKDGEVKTTLLIDNSQLIDDNKQEKKDGEVKTTMLIDNSQEKKDGEVNTTPLITLPGENEIIGYKHDSKISRSTGGMSALGVNYTADSMISRSDVGMPTLNADYLAEIDRLHIISLLRRRAAHLPGNNWYQDWQQFVCNNHPFLGLFLHHPLHPMLLSQRVYIFIASISFGLLVTSLIFLHYMYSTENFDEKVIRIYIQIKDGTFSPLEISRGMVSVWLNNGLLHAIFDVSLWHMSACTCLTSRNNHRKLEEIGSYIVVGISGLLSGLALCAVLIRALAMEKEKADAENLDWRDIEKWEAFAFLAGFFVELVGVYFLIYPIVITIIFSGVFGCFPGKLGGRPRDLQIEINRLLQERTMYTHHEIL